MSLDMTYFNEMEAKIPHGKVRTRFAPSPTGYMHVGNLRTALYTWLIARNAGGTFILRIEDTDQGRLIEGATDVIYRTLAECGLDHDEGPDVGGPVAPYIQSERRDTYGKYAELLVERGGAYYCFCEKTESAEDSGVTQAGETYTKEDARGDRMQVYAHTGFQYIRLYAPAVLLGAASITCILTSHKLMRKRNMALAAAYATLDKHFKDYRGRVLERFGEQVEKELRYNIKAKEIETTVVDENGKEKKVKETVDVAAEGWDPSKYSPYARIFDEGHPAYMKDAEQNKFYLLALQAQANDRLKSRGHLFLNEVYEMLGFRLTKAGAVVGWIYDPREPMGDNFVDFGMFEVCREKAVDFVNGYERSFILDFNVVGDITDALATHQTL